LRTAPTELVLLGAKDATGLVEQCRLMAERPGELAQTARASQLGFRGSEAARLALVAATAEDLSEKLLRTAAAIEKSPATPFVAPTGISYSAAPPDPGRVAFVFPGQGSQYVGMGADVAMSIDAARAAWDRAAAHAFDGRGLHQIVFPAPAFTDDERDAQRRALTATEWAQPALGVQSAALLRVLSALGVRPDCVAGHSFGEVAALHAAGALDEATLLRVARRRGELMREAASIPGAMTAVARSIDEVRPILAEVLTAAGGEVVIANHNAPEQVVLSGAKDAIARVEEALAATRIPSKRLTVATAFHSPLVADSSAPFLEYLRGVDLAAPEIDVYGCADAKPYSRDPEAVRRRLAAQLAQPVCFVEQIEAMYESGVRTFVEVGAGSVLSELIDRILGAREHHAIHLDRKGRNGLTSLQLALGRLAVAGVPMKLCAFWDDQAPPLETPVKKQAMAIPVSGVNQGKPYPPAGGAKELPPPNPPRPVEPPARRVTLAADSPPERLPEPPARAVTETLVTPPPLEIHGEWLRAYQEAQRQTAEAHAAYQRAMADSHMAFLRTAETSFAGLSALLGGRPGAVAPSMISEQPAAPVFLPAVVESPVIAPAFVAPVSMPIVAPEPLAARIVRDPAPEQPAARVVPQPSIAASESAAASVDLEALLMSVVADKTGYPTEMLGVHMDLEADLGIDSIKRVEILAAFRERTPGLPEVNATELGRLRTLGQIVEHMRALQDAPASHPAIGDARPATHGIEAVAAAPAIARRVLREISVPAVGLAPPGLHAASEGSEVVVTEDGGGLAPLVVEEFAQRGVKARVASEVPPDAGAVIFLGGMRAVGNIDEAIAVDREAFHAARAVAARFEAEGGLFAAVQDTGGDFGLSGRAGLHAWSGGLSALARTAALEWPRASVRAIDCERGDRSVAEVARAIVEELCTGGVTPDVGLHAEGARTTLALVEAGVTPEARPRIDAGSVVVASGGGRGVTAAALVALARACRPRIVLLGRTPLPAERDDLHGNDELALRRAMATKARAEGRELNPAEISARVAVVLAQRDVRATLDALAAAGSPARYLAVDVQDADAIRVALDDVRSEWGPVTALVHGAGILADKRIVDKTDDQFDRVFDTKVAGLRALLSATARDPLEAICVFSSIAARTGNPGQCDYSMANEVLNLVAASERARRGAGCVVRSICWGPWAGGMVTPSLEKHFAQMGVPLIPLDAGARVFVDELRGGGGEVAIVVGGAAGGGPLGAEAARAVSLELRVDAASHPQLADHRIAGTAVVPVVIAIDWILRGALAVRSDLACVSVRDVKVLRPLKLEHFDCGGDLVLVRCRQVAGDSDQAEISVELRGRGDTLHYRAAVDLARRPPAAPPTPSTPPLEAFDAAGVYDGHVLFHGARFRVILDVEGISRAGIAGTLQGSAATGWPRDGWRTDPALLDGGLQLAVVWARHVLGGASLPMAVRELRSYREGFLEGPVHCVVSARETREVRAVSDVVFTDASGAVVAELLGVETVKRPDEPAPAATALG
jgi:malonyl CoA-acyl carrier protein transacylase/NADP-dependent 3-hydroxy acid dehydrogenase YdfG